MLRINFRPRGEDLHDAFETPAGPVDLAAIPAYHRFGPGKRHRLKIHIIKQHTGLQAQRLLGADRDTAAAINTEDAVMAQQESVFIARQGADTADIQAGQALAAARHITAQRDKGSAGSRQLRTAAALLHQEPEDGRKAGTSVRELRVCRPDFQRGGGTGTEMAVKILQGGDDDPVSEVKRHSRIALA